MTNGMRNRARRTRERVDARLADIENDLIAATTLDWDSIRPDLADQAEYDRLMEIVEKSTQRNENIGQFVSRLKELGEGGVALLEKVKTFIIA